MFYTHFCWLFFDTSTTLYCGERKENKKIKKQILKIKDLLRKFMLLAWLILIKESTIFSNDIFSF